jgi:hypothetical protein
MFGNEIGDSGTYTKSYQSSEKFQVTLPSPTLSFPAAYVAYLLKMRAYSDAAGVMNLGFAIDLRDDKTAWLWRDGGSVYSMKPDPSLVLPGRYGMAKSDDRVTNVFVPNKDPHSATQIRSIWFYDEDAQEYSSSAFTKGRAYKISLSVYNASFVDAGTVPIEVGYTDAMGGANAIGRYNVSLKGWSQDTENNKAKVEFEWTVPANMAQGNYDFYFQIDPDNLIDEVHENWNVTEGDPGYDPSGNNRGRYPFAVLSEAASVSSTQLGSVRAASAQDGSFTIKIDGMSFEDFRKSLSGRTEDFRAHGVVTFHGDESLKNVHVHIVDVSGANTQRLVLDRYIPAIFPGVPTDFSFMVSPSKLENANLLVSIHADNATFTAEIEPEPEPEPEHSGGGSGCSAGGGALSLAIFALAVAAIGHNARPARPSNNRRL